MNVMIGTADPDPYDQSSGTSSRAGGRNNSNNRRGGRRVHRGYRPRNPGDLKAHETQVLVEKVVLRCLADDVSKLSVDKAQERLGYETIQQTIFV